MTTLYIRHPGRADGATTPCQYALVASGGALLQQGACMLGALRELIGQARRVVLLLAGTDVTLLQLKVPPLSKARLTAALPGLVEDHILGDPADCVLVPGAPSGDAAMRTIAVAQRAWLETLVKSVRAQGAQQVTALPFQLCLPFQPGAVSAALGAHDLTMRQSQSAGMGVTVGGTPAAVLATVRALAGTADVTLTLAAEQLGAFQAVGAAGIALEAEQWTHWIGAAKICTLDLVPGLGAAGAHAHNWARWRWPLRIALAALLVNVVALNVEWLRMKREGDALRLAMLQTFKTTYPKETVIQDPILQMRQKIAAAKAASGQTSTDDFIGLSAAYGEASRALPKKPDIIGIEYREHALSVHFKPDSSDPATLQALGAALAVHKLGVTEGAANVWQIRSAGVKK